MKNKIYSILLILCSFLSFAQDIEFIKIMHKSDFNYLAIHHKKTVNYDEIDGSKNILLVTTSADIKNLSKCSKDKCYTKLDNDTLVSSDFIFPSSLNIKNKLGDLKPYMTNYLDKLVISQEVLKKKSGYILYQNKLKNVIIIVLQMTKSYYNAHTNNLKLCGNPDDKIVLYRFLNGNDEYELENGTL
ncbi:hypothetical protein DRF59_00035 [Chryseobacterium flavum]|uniref:Uncharacterized protein n=1 Tax=Chryseobacterium flavum TaxID=415851 RepID=A0A3D9CU71_9FLAO|nr:hypothetical protein [Chryseobacterium flavum]REC69302.1 hypothetical protein DRF59_00035 [Chryseobacterium flavum]